jgi:hypothetical protein
MATSSRRYLVPLVAAITVLAALAAVIGWQLGLRSQGSGDDSPITINNNNNTTPPTTGPALPPCLQVTQDAAHTAGAAAGQVSRVLYINTGRAEVWICQDTAGKFYYQGHQGDLNDRSFPAISDSSIFLTDVVQQGDGYVATNKTSDGSTTTYTVTPTRLVVVTNGKTRVDEAVTSTTPPS